MDLERMKLALEVGDADQKAEALSALSDLEADAGNLPALVAMIEDKAIQDHLGPLFDALVAGGVAVDELLRLAGSRRPKLQIEAARALGVLGDPAAIPLLEKRVQSKRAELRAAAEHSLEALKSPAPDSPAPESEGADGSATDEARRRLELLGRGDSDQLEPLFEFLRQREGESEQTRVPEDPISAVEVEIIDGLTAFASANADSLVRVADVLHELRRGRFGCSIRAELAAKRAIDDLTNTQLISSYRAWREDLTGDETPAAEPSPRQRTRQGGSPRQAPPEPVVPTPRVRSQSVKPTPATRHPAPPGGAESPEGEPGTAPLPPSGYWDRPPRRKKPWWKFW